MASSEQPKEVYAALALGVVSFAFSPVLVRLAADAAAGGAPGPAIAAWRTGLATLMLAPFAFWQIGPDVRRLSRRDGALIGGAGVLLGLHYLAWIESLYHTSVASSSVLVTTSPLFLAVLGYALLGERLQRRTLAAIALAVVGAALIGWGDAAGGPQAAAPRPLWGNSLALSASLLVSFYLLIGRIVRQRVSWLAYVFPLYAVAALTVWSIVLVRGVPLFGYGWAFYGLCALMAFGPQVVGHGSFNYAVQYFPAALVGMLALLEPVGASTLAFFLFGEVPTGLATVGMLVVLVAVGAGVWVRRRAEAEAPA